MHAKDVKKRIINISYALGLSHLGSCLTMVDLLDTVYKVRKKDDPVILSAGHSALALYAVLEKYEGVDAQVLFDTHGVHPNRDRRNGKPIIWASSGSLGHGLGISVGYALANPNKTIYCLTTDGELAEGAMYEALRIASEYDLDNMKLVVNANGYSAYQDVDPMPLISRLQSFGWGVYKAKTKQEIEEGLGIFVEKTPIATFVETKFEFPFLEGINAHYMTMTEENYKQAMEVLNVSAIR